MKSSSLPAVRVDPELRRQLEHVLQEGETLSSFVEASVRESVRRRAEQSAFVARGIASLEAAKLAGRYVTAESVVAKLQARLKKKAQARVPSRRATPAQR